MRNEIESGASVPACGTMPIKMTKKCLCTNKHSFLKREHRRYETESNPLVPASTQKKVFV